jgi:hypothetical protein
MYFSYGLEGIDAGRQYLRVQAVRYIQPPYHALLPRVARWPAVVPRRSALASAAGSASD